MTSPVRRSRSSSATTTAWCAACLMATEHQPHPLMPYGLECCLCGTVRVEKVAR